ncbi:hypothetical protein O7626_40450 [Micromonospora sp. WMMD1102]|uniref:hypothetical protein n=1 Tax=Micromonospora sp. WMMD1102 TaxID=3016105 RepID=UPI0024153E36|nr:hypothetical protein [Micromonospora sp. WMMD1102]MDG4792090.1 hypothetical protein [Micromonospora sp. WMMD1102]
MTSPLDPRRRFNDTERAALYLAADGKCTGCGVVLQPGWHADHHRMTDVLRRNANLVDALGSALRQGEHAIGTVPALVKRVLQEESWREFVTQRGEHVQHEAFDDFVEAAPLQGLGATPDLIERIVEGDDDATRLLRAARLRRPGPKLSSRNNIPGTEDDGQPRGTSRAYALARLQRDAPDLYDDVRAKRISAHAAMVKAGFTPPRFTVQVTSADAIAETLRRRLPPEILTEVVARLAS